MIISVAAQNRVVTDISNKVSSIKKVITIAALEHISRRVTNKVIIPGAADDVFNAEQAVNAIRAKRRGAINARQLGYLENQYKRRAKSGKCAVM